MDFMESLSQVAGGTTIELKGQDVSAKDESQSYLDYYKGISNTLPVGTIGSYIFESIT